MYLLYMYMYILTHEYLMPINKEQCCCWDDNIIPTATLLIYSYKNIIDVIYFQKTTGNKFHFKHQQNLNHNQDKMLM